jgi:hypothetical protein
MRGRVTQGIGEAKEKGSDCDTIRWLLTLVAYLSDDTCRLNDVIKQGHFLVIFVGFLPEEFAWASC